MLPRERLLIALSLGVPDRVPKALGFYPDTLGDMEPEQVADYFGIEVRFVEFEASNRASEYERYLESLAAELEVGSPRLRRTYAEWGYLPGESERNPLAGLGVAGGLGDYLWPDLSSDYRWRKISSQVDDIKGRGYAAAGNLPHLGGAVFEAATRLRGFEQFMIDLLAGKEIAHYLIGQLTELAEENARILTAAGIDVLVVDDDIGMPERMIISPETWREFLKPSLARIIGAARQVNPGLHVLYHSDGYIEPVILDLLEIGVSALNPVQPDRMDPGRVKCLYGSQVALWGGIGVQGLLTFGNREQIRSEVRTRIGQLGRNGGYVACPAYDVDYGVPWENIVALMEAIDDYGSHSSP
jgi:uroporphyrinogen decarboxylase